MPIFLHEHQIGFDTTTVGFPNLGDRMALVLQTPGGLYGFHVMPAQGVRSGAFHTFFTGRSAGVTCLLPAESLWPRGSKRAGLAARQAEMQSIAKAIAYQGSGLWLRHLEGDGDRSNGIHRRGVRSGWGGRPLDPRQAHEQHGRHHRHGRQLRRGQRAAGDQSRPGANERPWPTGLALPGAVSGDDPGEEGRHERRPGQGNPTGERSMWSRRVRSTVSTPPEPWRALPAQGSAGGASESVRR